MKFLAHACGHVRFQNAVSRAFLRKMEPQGKTTISNLNARKVTCKAPGLYFFDFIPKSVDLPMYYLYSI